MPTAGDITCRELVELVTEYLEGALPDGERRRFEEHLVDCAGCRDHLDQMRTTIALVGRLTEQDLTPEAERAFLAAFRRWKEGYSTGHRDGR